MRWIFKGLRRNFIYKPHSEKAETICTIKHKLNAMVYIIIYYNILYINILFAETREAVFYHLMKNNILNLMAATYHICSGAKTAQIQWLLEVFLIHTQIMHFFNAVPALTQALDSILYHKDFVVLKYQFYLYFFQLCCPVRYSMLLSSTMSCLCFNSWCIVYWLL